jgi:hypothetical protein
MKKYIRNTVIALVLGAFLASQGCTGDFEKLNTDPDNPIEVPVDNLLAWTIWYTSYRFYDRWFMLDEPCAFAGYVAKLSYIDEARYQFRAGIQDNSWSYVYRTLLNLRAIQTIAREDGLTNLELAAMTMEVEVMQIATDRWRDIPYSNAVKMDESVVTPTYDTQEDIYPALLALAKETGDRFADGGGDDDISTGDILFHGNMDRWRRFVNSLRLRMAIRISDVSPLGRQHVEEILGNPGRYPLTDSNADNVFFWWDGADNTRYEPIADAYRTRQTEFCAPDLLVDHMLERADPRISTYFTPTPSSQTPGDDDYDGGKPLYRGYIIGASSNPPAKNYSVWGQRYGIDLGGFSPYYRAAEVYFHIAEAASLGYNTGGITAEEAYNKAIELSMEENGVSAAEAQAYLEGAGKFANNTKQIWYEEWVAMFKQGMEGWSLYRRTGVPENNYIAPGRAERYADHTTPPFRSPYPDKERNLNKGNNAPFNADVTDDFWGKQMWWDKRTGVH